ncbi:MAG: hypothetical protein AMXMBFR33_27050 [Candidatus Xenobia bacterium]|jgi:hypothetical protein
MSLKDVGKTTPIVEVIRRVLEKQQKPMSLEELTMHVMESWGRDFPNNPYEDVSLIYKLATRVLRCQVFFDETGGEPPTVQAEDARPEPMNQVPFLTSTQLNVILDQLRHVKLSLAEVQAAAGNGKKK